MICFLPSLLIYSDKKFFSQFSLFFWDIVHYAPRGKMQRAHFYLSPIRKTPVLCFHLNDLFIYIKTFYWLLLSKSPLSQSEALIYKRRSALLELVLDFIHVFESRHFVSPFCYTGEIVKEICFLVCAFSLKEEKPDYCSG